MCTENKKFDFLVIIGEIVRPFVLRPLFQYKWTLFSNGNKLHHSSMENCMALTQSPVNIELVDRSCTSESTRKNYERNYATIIKFFQQHNDECQLIGPSSELHLGQMTLTMFKQFLVDQKNKNNVGIARLKSFRSALMYQY